ncbi:MAG: hypothetical protein JKY52_04835 [Flavobacteriales bacterium]|nr:hypothetical protein [Flavobacteriales bacterium]
MEVGLTEILLEQDLNGALSNYAYYPEAGIRKDTIVVLEFNQSSIRSRVRRSVFSGRSSKSEAGLV